MNKSWFDKIPHPVFLLFLIILLAGLLTFIVPSGEFQRELIEGRMRVIPGTFSFVDGVKPNLLSIFRSIPLGFKAAAEIIFVVLAGGIMFMIIDKTGMIENAIGSLIKKLGLQRKYLIVVIVTFVYGALGIFVGYESNIAMIPIAAVLSLALGGDLILAAGISAGAITVGFGLSPVNPYTVGIGHQIAELPLFSGAILRSLLCFVGLAMLSFYNVRYFIKIDKEGETLLSKGLNTKNLGLKKNLDEYSMSIKDYLLLSIFIGGLGLMLFGIFNYGWYINEISAFFLMIAVAIGITSRMSINEFCEKLLDGISMAAPGAFMVGYAAAIKEILQSGKISDSICFYLSDILSGLPASLSAIAMSASQCIINLFIPSGSGQALATLPIMIPLGDLLGISRQVAILAFQIGDGVTNLFNPTLGGLIAMIALCRVPLDRWLRYILPFAAMLIIVSWVILYIATIIGWQ